MGSLSDYAENKLLDHVFNVAYTPPATVYLALCTADPTDAGTGAAMNEVANANAYARRPITFGAAAARRITQSGDVQFAMATGAWGAVTHWAILDSGAHGAGNLLAHGSFLVSFSPVMGTRVTVPTALIYVEIQATAAGAGYTTYLVNKLLDLMFRNQAYAKPNTFVALLNGLAADSDATNADIAEITGTSYARVQVNPAGGASPAWVAAAAGAIANAQAIGFASPGASDWLQVVAMAIVDAAANPCNVLAYDNANIVDQTPLVGDVIYFDVGELDLSLT